MITDERDEKSIRIFRVIGPVTVDGIHLFQAILILLEVASLLPLLRNLFANHAAKNNDNNNAGGRPAANFHQGPRILGRPL